MYRLSCCAATLEDGHVAASARWLRSTTTPMCSTSARAARTYHAWIPETAPACTHPSLCIVHISPCVACVFVHSMWLPINGEPPPNGGAGAGAGAGGGAFGGPKKSNLSRAVMRARVTKSDSAAAKAVDANKKRVRDEKGKQQNDVAEVRVDIGELKDAIKEAGVSVDNVAAVEKKVGAVRPSNRRTQRVRCADALRPDSSTRW